jgi:hypothetical protein
MKFPIGTHRHFVWLNLPSLLLITFLQRIPVTRLASVSLFSSASSPIGTLLRSAFTGVAALGSVHALAGATQLSTTMPSPVNVAVGTSITIGFAITGTTSGADSWTHSGATPPGLSFGDLNSEVLRLTGTVTAPGAYTFFVQAHDAIGGDTTNYSFTINVTGQSNVAPTITTHPSTTIVNAGTSLTLSVNASGTPAPSYQWLRNGRVLSGETQSTLSRTQANPNDAGLYTVTATNAAGAESSNAAIVAIATNELFTGAAFSDPTWRTISHPNGNIYTQVLLTGTATTVTADPGKTTRLSYIDLQDDIVQLEFSGPGSMTVTLDNASGPALPSKYNQNVEYMKGHATVILQGTSANSFFSAFSVGRLTAVNQSLFRDNESYDGHADLARLVIQSPTGQFAGLFIGNGAFNDLAGDTGIYAPGVSFSFHIRVRDISAFDNARPVLLLGGTPNPENGLRILGGDLEQPNARPIEISGVGRVMMSAGTDSHNRFEPAQTNKGRLVTNGTDVTATLIVNPSP